MGRAKFTLAASAGSARRPGPLNRPACRPARPAQPPGGLPTLILAGALRMMRCGSGSMRTGRNPVTGHKCDSVIGCRVDARNRSRDRHKEGFGVRKRRPTEENRGAHSRPMPICGGHKGESAAPRAAPSISSCAAATRLAQAPPGAEKKAKRSDLIKFYQPPLQTLPREEE